MFSAGVVSATLSGNFSPVGFMAFDAATKKSKVAMDKMEASIGASSARVTAANGRMGASAAAMAGLTQDAQGRWRNATGQYASDAEKAAAGVQRSTNKMGKALATVGKVAGVGAAGGLLAFGLVLGKSVSLAADFEHQLSLLGSASSANGKQMDQLRKSALAAGAATKYSALEAAQAQTALAKGGLEVKDILGGGLKGALGLAAAGEIDLAQAAETTVNAMNNFQLGADQAVHVSDALAKAAVSTTTDVGPLATALTEAGSSAHSAGVTFDSTVVALEALAKMGVQGSLAGGSLKSAINNLLTPSKKQTDTAKEAGIAVNAQGQAFITAGGNLKSFSAISAELRDKLGGMTKAQRTATESILAGSYGVSTLQALYAAGPTKLAAYEKGLNDTGFAARLAAKNQDNLRGKIENLKGSLETAGIALGTGLLPGLTEGAEKATDAINKMVASGDIDQFGKDLGSGLEAVVEAGPKIASSMKIAAFGVKTLFDAVKGSLMAGLSATLTPVEAILRAVRGAVDLANKISPFKDIPTGGLSKVIDKLGDLRKSAFDAGKDVVSDVGKIAGAVNNFSGTGKDINIKVKGDTSSFVGALKRVQAANVSDKVVKILAQGDTTTRSKIKAIEALGIGPKTAKILADNAKALAGIGSVRAALAALQNKTLTITTREIHQAENRGAFTSGPARRGAKASGRGPGGAETALVGEGRGGELVGNPVDGWAWVDQPTIMDLGPRDAVVPEDPRYAGRALGMMFAAMGVPGYAKGKKPKLAVPDAVRYGGVSEDSILSARDNAREDYQKRKGNVHDLDVKIREQEKKVASTKGKAHDTARAKLRDLKKDRAHYSGGGGGLHSLSWMRQHYEDLAKQAQVLHATNLEIDRLDKVQSTDRTKMETASKRGDAGAWGTAKKDRDGILAKLKTAYTNALKYAKGANFKADLEGKLADIDSQIADAGSDAFAGPDMSDGMTDAERARYGALQAQQSLAALTAGLGDDRAAAQNIEAFLSTVLGEVLADPDNRGGSAAVSSVADALKQARDNVASFSSSGGSQNADADLQAQLDQQRTRAETAERNAQISDRALSVFQGAGDIGQGPVTNIYTLHPGDPRTLAAVGDAAAAGFSQQAARTTPRTNLGL